MVLAPSRGGATTGLRQAARGVHRWLGVVLGLWMAFQSLTGIILLFADPMEHSLHAELTRYGNGDKGAAAALAAVRQAYPGEEIGVLATPAVSDGVYVVEAGEHEVYVDPAGPVVNGSRHHDAGFVALVARLHRRFLFDSLLGLPGGWIVGALGLAWLALFFTGLTTAAPDQLRRWWRADPPGLHRTVGVLAIALMVLVIVTGIRLAVPEASDRAWAAVTGSGLGRSDVPPQGVRITSDDRGGAPRDATEILGALQRRYPDARVARLLMPQPDDRVAPVIAGLSVDFDPGRNEHDYGGNTVVFVDQFSGDTLWVGRPDALPVARQAALLWSRPLHTGSLAGEGARLLWGLLAVAVATLATLGWITGPAPRPARHQEHLRWQRQARRRKAIARRQRTHAARTTRAARHRRRASRRLRRRRKVQAQTLARMGRVPREQELPPPPVHHSGGVVEIDLTDSVEIDLTDPAEVEPEDDPEDVSSRLPPG